MKAIYPGARPEFLHCHEEEILTSKRFVA
jgi:hypothetical protein